jgi:hypothetical protein
MHVPNSLQFLRYSALKPFDLSIGLISVTQNSTLGSTANASRARDLRNCRIVAITSGVFHPENSSVEARKSLYLCLSKRKKGYPEAGGFWGPEPCKQSRRGNIWKQKSPGARITETGDRINKCGRPAYPEKAGRKSGKTPHPSFYIIGGSK